MERFAKKKKNQQQCLSAGGAGEWFVELGHFDKDLVKNTSKRDPTWKQFRNFSPTYP